jgi:hypothetical protein
LLRGRGESGESLRTSGLRRPESGECPPETGERSSGRAERGGPGRAGGARGIG